MAMQRRRQNGRCPIPVVSSAAFVFSVAAVGLLLVLAVFSFLTPPLLDRPFLSPDRRMLKRSTRKSDDLQKNAVTNTVPFGVQSKGSTRHDLWSSKASKYYYGCSNASSSFEAAKFLAHPNRYLMIATSGGLNQQRTGIIDAVVAARILNATLVVPKLDQRSFWKDSSNFSEIFDIDWFISFLSKDVKVIKQLPVKGGKVIGTPYTMRVPRKCTPSCYQKRVLPVLNKKHIVQLTKFDYRLANRLTTDLQKLRCRVNYHALRFTDPIVAMGEKLVQRMKGNGKHFIALHLRFEPDMLAFSGCYYGGGDKERRELGKIRKRWKTLHISDPEKGRRHGRCPLTPEEVGLLLRALGFGKEVHLYVASGVIYGGEETLAPLKALFPNFHTKETLARKEELALFSDFSSRMAALDFMVCDESDVFVTNNNGNMAKILAGRRRYFGHKRTIRPNARKLYSLFLNRANMTWEVFSSKVRTYQRGFMGDPKEIRPGRGEFHENPATCICESAEAKTDEDSGSKSQQKTGAGDGKWDTNINVDESLDDHDTYEDSDWNDLDYGENAPLAKLQQNETDADYNIFIKPEETELVEELLSD